MTEEEATTRPEAPKLSLPENIVKVSNSCSFLRQGAAPLCSTHHAMISSLFASMVQ